jgi:hypothetical protein
MVTRILLLASMLLIAGQALSTESSDWQPRVKQVGDVNANYLNVEITADSKYLVWFEGRDGDSTHGYMWHCQIDKSSGELTPPDCRGFRAFESTSWGRANPGYDASGPYYTGADTEGRIVMVRPTGATSGKVTILPTPADTRRRALYPTSLKSRKTGYILFIQNEKNSGAGMRPNNDWVELQYLDLAHPEHVHIIERQQTPRRGFAPMDAGFVRWMRGRPILTYGHKSEDSGKTEIRAYDVEHPDRGAFNLVEDGNDKIDPYPAVLNGYEYIMAGINATATSHIYRRPAGVRVDAPFELFRTLYPDGTHLKNPSLAQSHEPFVFKDRLYTVYQVNEKGRGFFDITFRQPGELWLADLSADPVKQWRIAPADGGPVTEPEPLVTDNCVWIFYSRPMVGEAKQEKPASADTPASTGDNEAGPLLRWFQQRRARSRPGLPRMALYRADVPICKAGAE